MEDLKKLLDKSKISYEVEEDTITIPMNKGKKMKVICTGKEYQVWFCGVPFIFETAEEVMKPLTT
jgi:hypothetical protein